MHPAASLHKQTDKQKSNISTLPKSLSRTPSTRHNLRGPKRAKIANVKLKALAIAETPVVGTCTSGLQSPCPLVRGDYHCQSCLV